jgi:cell division septation protein DedD
MADEDFHEIQLNGKQLVFLFMAGTVAAVVIFLCGLMVGRNLKVPRLEAAAATPEATIGDPTRPSEADLPPPTSEVGTGGTPVTINEKLTYSPRLEAPNPVEETIKPGEALAKTPPPKPEPVKTAKVPAPPNESVKEVAATPAAEPAGAGWTVQVQAVNNRADADAIVTRLIAKKYPAFVTDRGAGNPNRYRVRVGKYADRQEADTMKARLEKEEQFKPWVTR